jgi:acetamidase/formamidase
MPRNPPQAINPESSHNRWTNFRGQDHKTIRWPRAENQDFIMVLGSARPLLQALQHATTEMQRWLMADYGFDERGSSLLMGHMVQYDIANIVDPHFTVVAKIPKSCLTAKEMSK